MDSALIALMLLAHATGTVWFHLHAPLTRYADSPGYEEIAKLPVASAAFFLSERPFVLPLALKLAPSQEALTVAQSALYALAWGGLALALARLVRSGAARVTLVAVVLTLASTNDLALWNRSILTESLTLSLFAGGLALAALLVKPPTSSRARIAVASSLGVVMVLWVFLRDANAYLLLLMAGGALATALAVRAPRRAAIIAFAGALALTLVAGACVRHARRWRVPLVNVLGMRALPFAEKRAFFDERGLPPELRIDCKRGIINNFNCESYVTDPTRWLDGDRRGLYGRYLLSRPIEHAKAPLVDYGSLLHLRQPVTRMPMPVTYYPKAERPSWQRSLNSIVFTRTPFLLLLAMLFSAVLAFAIRRRCARAIWPSLAMLAAIYPMMFFVWHADAAEIERHAIVVAVLVRVALMFGVVAGVDALFTESRRGC